MPGRIVIEADEEVKRCLDGDLSFALVAGAGSGKTTSLIEALAHLRATRGSAFRRNGQRIACITYTKRAVEVIRSRLGFDDLFLVSTLHSFLWAEIGRFRDDIRDALIKRRIPNLIAKAKEKDNGGKSKEARKARAQILELEAQLLLLPDVPTFNYEDATYSNYGEGRLSHDDVIDISSFLFAERDVFRRLIGFRYPVVLVDEAQDTFDGIVTGLNLTCQKPGLPIVGYFGDPWQQIYEGRAGAFAPPASGKVITKTENFRCSASVIELLNAFRTDVKQYPAGKNKDRVGSVVFTLVQAETPELPRKRYSDAQIDRALQRFDQALTDWGWQNSDEIVKLFLVRQMIARRLGFPKLHQLFTDELASSRAQEAYEEGSHFLLKPIVEVVWPLLEAQAKDDSRQSIDLLRHASPSFSTDGPNRDKTLLQMIDQAQQVLSDLKRVWDSGIMRDVFTFCKKAGLIKIPDRLLNHLKRQPRAEVYDEELYGADREDWLVDAYFSMPSAEIGLYCAFLSKNTAYSTQHGVKGEEYSNVLVVYDDIEAAWSQYSFTKLLTPVTAGDPTEGQFERGRKLAYVCFSRSTEHLRVLLFTPSPKDAAQELISRGLVKAEQIRIQNI